MTDYKPGLYAVTSWRGERQLAFRTERGEDMRWCVLDGADTRGLSDCEVRDVRRLVALDLADVPMIEIQDENADGTRRYAQHVADAGYHIAADVLRFIADQIEAQTKPPRIPEPGLWGVVKASTTNGVGLRKWARLEHGWVSSDGVHHVAWNHLVDPVLIREGADA